MALSFQVPYLSDNVPVSIQIVLASIVLGLVYFVYSTITKEKPWKDIPVASLEEQGLSPKASWTKQGRATVRKGTKTYDGPFQVVTGTGPKIVLPNRYAEEVKSRPDLSFAGAFAKDFFINYPGFDAFKHGLEDDGFIAEVARVKLTQSLGLITEDLVDETTAAIHDIFGEDKEWHETKLKQGILHLVARLSSRVFLGLPLCRNERWLEIAKDYTVDAFIAARLLKTIPSAVRPFVSLFLPHCVRLRRHVRDAHTLINPEVEKRKQATEKALQEGKKAPKTADTIGWMYEIAREKREKKDYVLGQLSLTLAAIHTTTEALTAVLIDVCQHPEIVQPLRDEVVQVIGEEGWTKTALYKLRLMDSFLKESQRYRSGGVVSMNRLVTEKITLSDGFELPANARIMIAARNFDPATYKNPETFDPYRFFHEREKPNQGNNWQHVTVSSAHMGFGYGQHACPGRFFASNELKIALSHLLMKYDFKLLNENDNLFWDFEANTSTKPGCKVMMKRRTEEINMDLVE